MVLVFKDVRFDGKFWRIVPQGYDQTKIQGTSLDQMSGKQTTMSLPAFGVVYHTSGKGTVTVIAENPAGTNRTYNFRLDAGDEVYIDCDVIHIPKLPLTGVPVP